RVRLRHEPSDASTRAAPTSSSCPVLVRRALLAVALCSIVSACGAIRFQRAWSKYAPSAERDGIRTLARRVAQRGERSRGRPALPDDAPRRAALRRVVLQHVRRDLLLPVRGAAARRRGARRVAAL